MLIQDRDITIVNAATGEVLRELVLDPTKRYHGTGAPWRASLIPDSRPNRLFRKG